MLSLQKGLCAREDRLKSGSLKTFDVSSSFRRKSSTFCGSAKRDMCVTDDLHGVCTHIRELKTHLN